MAHVRVVVIDFTLENNEGHGAGMGSRPAARGNSSNRKARRKAAARKARAQRAKLPAVVDLVSPSVSSSGSRRSWKAGRKRKWDASRPVSQIGSGEGQSDTFVKVEAKPAKCPRMDYQVPKGRKTRKRKVNRCRRTGARTVRKEAKPPVRRVAVELGVAMRAPKNEASSSGLTAESPIVVDDEWEATEHRPKKRCHSPTGTMTKESKVQVMTATKTKALSPGLGLTSESPIVVDDKDIEQEAAACGASWRLEEAVASAVGLPVDVVRGVVDMMVSDECTVPFLARYRRERTGGLDADKLREIREAYTGFEQVKKTAQTMLETLKREGQGDATLLKLILGARSIVELDNLFAPYKEAAERTLAHRARDLGLEESAMKILHGAATVESLNAESFVKPNVKGLQSAKDVLLGWKHILADVLFKDRMVLDFVANMAKAPDIVLETRKSGPKEKRARYTFATEVDSPEQKYDRYQNFSVPVPLIKPHQVLAINRGESLKALVVKLELPSHLVQSLKAFCKERLCGMGVVTLGKETLRLVQETVKDASTRLLEPHLYYCIRSQLTQWAEKESLNVFRSNLHQLLLTPPVKGHAVLGIDPGFAHGCKLAAVSANGKFLQHAVIHPHTSASLKVRAASVLKRIVLQHSCDLVALGDGTACRETEAFLSQLISQGHFEPIQLKYCIVPESGVSIYSVTKEAQSELPSLDPNIRSAVGIARRLQDPLLEYVKVEPKHLGVGMYQHDLSELVLKDTLEAVVVECVSFVGVDINVCPEAVLRKVSGLNAVLARNIVVYREAHGPFQNRQQLLGVPRLGNKAFEQCAGFVKVFPETASAVRPVSVRQQTVPAQLDNKFKSEAEGESVGASFNPLDMTVIHPESYVIAEYLLRHLNLDKNDIGKPCFIEKVRQEAAEHGINHFVNMVGGSIASMQLIVDALQHSVQHDMRSAQQQPLFKSGVLSLTDVRTNMELTGRVQNCTSFGAFVDIGVGTNGLIHTHNMSGQHVVLGDRVTVRVIGIDRRRSLLDLKLVAKQG